jgi:hypothetical protein
MIKNPAGGAAPHQSGAGRNSRACGEGSASDSRCQEQNKNIHRLSQRRSLVGEAGRGRLRDLPTARCSTRFRPEPPGPTGAPSRNDTPPSPNLSRGARAHGRGARPLYLPHRGGDGGRGTAPRKGRVGGGGRRRAPCILTKPVFGRRYRSRLAGPPARTSQARSGYKEMHISLLRQSIRHSGTDSVFHVTRNKLATQFDS